MRDLPGNSPAERAADRGRHLFILCGTLLVAGFLGWAAVGRLDIVADATGEVTPFSQVKSVQHLEGGIVSEILVREGDQVARDQPLMVLQSTATDAQVEELAVRLTSLRIDIARLEAEAAESATVSFADELSQGHAAEIEQARALFRSRRDRHLTAIATQTQAIAQREQALHEIAARLRGNRQTLALLEEQIRIGEELLKDKLTNRYNHLVLLRDAASLRGRIDEDIAAYRRTELAVQEARGQVEGIRHAYQQDVAEHLALARREFDEFSQRLRRLTDSQSRTVLRSPVEGIVKTLHIVTEGGVIQPGATVVDVVPAGDKLIVEARLPIYDVGYVRTGQTAKIRLAAAEGARFGAIDGTVIHVSPDALVTEQGAAYYRVRIVTAADHFADGPLIYRLYPGMQVRASIVTGERTVLQYLLDPFVGHGARAMRER